MKQCAVEVREDEAAGKRLVAYVVSEEGAEGKELREYLRGKLPEYMVPAAIVELERMPLTANGKLDRKALPEPAIEQAATEEDQPRTPVEEILCSIWADVLKVEGVGRRQDFFELGGHSLLATQVVSRVREAFDVEVPLKALFERPTVAGLAEAVERERGAGRRAEAPPIVAVGRDRELPLSFAQQRLWFIHQLDPDSAAYNIPRAVRLVGELDVSAITSSLRQIVARHEVLRTRFVAVDGQPSQVIDEPGEIDLAVWDVSELGEGRREERAREIVSREARRPFDLERGPVWRAGLVRLAGRGPRIDAVHAPHSERRVVNGCDGKGVHGAVRGIHRREAGGVGRARGAVRRLRGVAEGVAARGCVRRAVGLLEGAARRGSRA